MKCSAGLHVARIQEARVWRDAGRCVEAVLDGAWSHLSKALAAQGRAQLVPMLDANKPAWLAGLRLVRRGRCTPLSAVRRKRSPRSQSITQSLMNVSPHLPVELGHYWHSDTTLELRQPQTG